MADVGLGGGAHVLAPLEGRDPIAPEPGLLGERDVLGVDIKIHCHRGRLKVFCKSKIGVLEKEQKDLMTYR